MSKTLADAVFAAERSNKKNDKLAAISGLGGQDLKLLFETFNPYRVFGIRKYDDPTSYAPNDPKNYDAFLTLLEGLATRDLTGNVAKAAVTRTLAQYTQRTAAVLKRVLNKDLDCGANRDTFEKVYTNLGIPRFDQMLCGKIEYVKDKFGVMTYPKYDWRFPCYGEVKYDGFRLITTSEKSAIKYQSRGGKPADQWNGLFDADMLAIEAYVGEPIVLDGEALSTDGFSATAKAKGSANDKSTMKFFAFDWMTLREWQANKCEHPQAVRTATLTEMIKKLGLTTIIKSHGKVLKNMQDANDFYKEVIELGTPGQDEGLIIKQMDGLYEWTDKRTDTWAKWKPVIDVDVTVTGCYLGDGKNAKILGGFNVEGEDENGNKIKSNCGGFKVNSKKFKVWFAEFAKQHSIDISEVQGFNPKGTVAKWSKDEFFRTFVWNNQHLFVGRTIMIECQELSQAQNSDTFALRFPFFIQVRDDK